MWIPGKSDCRRVATIDRRSKRGRRTFQTRILWKNGMDVMDMTPSNPLGMQRRNADRRTGKDRRA